MQKLTIFAMLLLFAGSFAMADAYDKWTKDFDKLLKKYVKKGQKKGITANLVDYAGLRKDPLLGNLRGRLASLPVKARRNSSVEKRLAFWINAYNFLVLNKVAENPGLRQLSDLDQKNHPVWKQVAGVISGKKYSLDEVEHQVIRKHFAEPRIHFALVCAALSCPDLRPEAYFAAKLDAQLEEQLKSFLANSKKGMRLDQRSGKLQLSELFNWFKGDFTKKPQAKSPVVWLQKKGYIPPHFSPKRLKVSFLNYDWDLNAQKGRN